MITHFNDLNVIVYDGEKIEIEIKSVDELIRVFKLSNELHLPVFTLPVDGDVERGIWIYFNFEDLNDKLDKASKIYTTMVDIEIGDLEYSLRDKGFTLGHFPFSTSHRKTLREYFAGGFGFQTSPFFSRHRDLYTAGYFILPDGRRFKTVLTPRTAAGPDIGRFLFGSGELFAILLQLSMRVYPIPDRYVEVAFTFLRWSEAIDGIREIFKGRVNIDHLYLFNSSGWEKIFPGEGIDNNLLLFRLPVFDEALVEARLRYIERILKKGKRIPEEKSRLLIRKVQDYFNENPLSSIYAGKWSTIEGITNTPVIIIGGDVEGAGVGVIEEEREDLLLVYHQNIKEKMKWLKKWNPILYSKLLELKREVDPENLLNPHLLEG